MPTDRISRRAVVRLLEAEARERKAEAVAAIAKNPKHRAAHGAFAHRELLMIQRLRAAVEEMPPAPMPLPRKSTPNPEPKKGES